MKTIKTEFSVQVRELPGMQPMVQRTKEDKNLCSFFAIGNLFEDQNVVHENRFLSEVGCSELHQAIVLTNTAIKHNHLFEKIVPGAWMITDKDEIDLHLGSLLDDISNPTDDKDCLPFLMSRENGTEGNVELHTSLVVLSANEILHIDSALVDGYEFLSPKQLLEKRINSITGIGCRLEPKTIISFPKQTFKHLF